MAVVDVTVGKQVPWLVPAPFSAELCITTAESLSCFRIPQGTLLSLSLVSTLGFGGQWLFPRVPFAVFSILEGKRSILKVRSGSWQKCGRTDGKVMFHLHAGGQAGGCRRCGV